MEDIKRILVMSRATKSCHKAVHYGSKLSKMIGRTYSPIFLTWRVEIFSSPRMKFVKNISRRKVKQKQNLTS